MAAVPICLNMVGQSKTRKYSENIYSILTFVREKSGIEQSSEMGKGGPHHLNCIT